MTVVAPEGVVLDLAARAGDSPSQERLSRIAALLRDAEMAAHPSARRRSVRPRPVRSKH